jgi:Domain of unknown function (DUF6456)
MTRGSTGDRARARIVRFLSRTSAVAEAQPGGRMLLDGGEHGIVSVEAAALAAATAAGLVEEGGSGVFRLTNAGLALAKRLAAAAGHGFQEQHREMTEVFLDVDGARIGLAANAAESPLALLARRKVKDGRPFLSVEEWRAGERLRADYTRGRMMPCLGARWEAPVSSGRRGGSGIADLTHSALAARQRVDRALDAVGPELSGVLVDICCFLKGLERVEMERGWPVRSAKVVLKTALGALHRHYEPPPPRRNGTKPQILQWGAADFRPRIG